MIQKPAAATGYTFEPGLVDRSYKMPGKEPGHLPLVAYALKQLFELREQKSEPSLMRHIRRSAEWLARSAQKQIR